MRHGAARREDGIRRATPRAMSFFVPCTEERSPSMAMATALPPRYRHRSSTTAETRLPSSPRVLPKLPELPPRKSSPLSTKRLVSDFPTGDYDARLRRGLDRAMRRGRWQLNKIHVPKSWPHCTICRKGESLQAAFASAAAQPCAPRALDGFTRKIQQNGHLYCSSAYLLSYKSRGCGEDYQCDVYYVNRFTTEWMKILSTANLGPHTFERKARGDLRT